MNQQQLNDLHDTYMAAVRELRANPEDECVVVDTTAGTDLIATVVLVHGGAAAEISRVVRTIMDRWQQPQQPFFPGEQE